MELEIGSVVMLLVCIRKLEFQHSKADSNNATESLLLVHVAKHSTSIKL